MDRFEIPPLCALGVLRERPELSRQVCQIVPAILGCFLGNAAHSTSHWCPSVTSTVTPMCLRSCLGAWRDLFCSRDRSLLSQEALGMSKARALGLSDDLPGMQRFRQQSGRLLRGGRWGTRHGGGTPFVGREIARRLSRLPVPVGTTQGLAGSCRPCGRRVLAGDGLQTLVCAKADFLGTLGMTPNDFEASPGRFATFPETKSNPVVFKWAKNREKWPKNVKTHTNFVFFAF